MASNKEEISTSNWSLKNITDDEIIKFLELLEEQTCLWDISHPLYENAIARRCAFADLTFNMKRYVHQFDVRKTTITIESIFKIYKQWHKKSGMFQDNVKDSHGPTIAWYATADRFLHNWFFPRYKQKFDDKNTSAVGVYGEKDEIDVFLKLSEKLLRELSTDELRALEIETLEYIESLL
ncbi:hypothetical protein CDAR_316511 [Caerostris darwini]|uniref:MADF domain-containing protein n=1 Tax=Caerostris darwini TaxID=1538125 RepID=A0AAV4UJ90_9ARAC|nr:hypothetical protein CDAR_316511 [Caerostris darwini]